MITASLWCLLQIPLAVTSLRTGQIVRDACTTAVPGGIEVQAPGFLPRRMEFSYTTGRLQNLWPADHLLPEWFTYEGLHGSTTAIPITRPLPGVMTVEPSKDLVADRPALEALTAAIDRINAVYYQREFQFRLVPPGSGGQVYVHRDPLDPVWRLPGYEHAGALAYWTIDEASVIRGGRILFYDFENVFFGGHLQKAMTHELVHITGVRGHPKGIPGVSEDGIMSSPAEHQDITAPEEDLMRWALRRKPGTRWPDDSLETGSALSAARARSQIVVCRIRVR